MPNVLSPRDLVFRLKDINCTTSIFSTKLSIVCFQLLDLCVLDIESLQFTYSVIAASALYHSSSRELALSVSGKQQKK